MNPETQTDRVLVASHTPRESRLPRHDLPLFALAIVAAVVLVWVLQMQSSLWLDELGTFWVIDGDLASTADRAWRFHGQTPLYYALLWGATEILGTSEIALRSLSLVSMIAAAIVLYRFSKRLFGRTAAMLSLSIFVVYPSVGSYASDARPYALALLATLLATTLLESWLSAQDSRRAIWYAIGAAAIVYVHYVFATILIAHMLYFGWHVSRSEPAARRQLWKGGLLAGLVFLVALSPTFPQVADLLGRRGELTFPASATLGSLFTIWAPAIAVMALVGVIGVRAARGGRLRPVPPSPLLLIGLGLVVPPLALLVLAKASDVVLWAPRYWFAAAPFGAMIFGALIASALRSARSTKAVAVTILMVGILAGASLEHSPEDWRSATRAANSISETNTTVLLFSALIELRSPDFLTEPEKRSYVNSPIGYYPVEGSVTPLPWTTRRDWDERVSPILSGLTPGEPVVVIANQAVGSPVPAMVGWFIANGYEMEEFQTFGSVSVTAFTPG